MFGAAGLISKKKGCFLWDDKDMEQFVIAVQENNPKALRKRIGKRKVEMNELLRFESGLEKMTALHFAAKEGFKPVLEELVQCGVDINIETQFDNLTPLHLACQYFEHDVALWMSEMLLKAGGSVNAQEHAGRTALIMASELGNLQLVQHLLDMGADINHCMKREEHPLLFTMMEHELPVLPRQTMSEYLDPYNGNNALMQACREHHFDIVLELVERSCLLDLKNQLGNTALHVAAKSQSKYFVKDDIMPINLSISSHPEILQLLVNAGADMNVVNNFEETPLVRALAGIGELSQFQMDYCYKKIGYEQAFHIAQILVEAGCKTSYKLKYCFKSSIQTLLYNCYKYLTPLSYDLGEKILTFICLLIMTGNPISNEDLAFAERIYRFRPNNKNNSVPDEKYTNKRFPQFTDENCTEFIELFELLRIYSKGPLMLKQLARISVRNTLPQPVSQSIRKLRLPCMLHKYASLKLL